MKLKCPKWWLINKNYKQYKERAYEHENETRKHVENTCWIYSQFSTKET